MGGLMMATVPATAQSHTPSDVEVKAAFLVNFPKYVEWPATAFATTNSPIRVAIFGDDNVAAEFEKILKDRKVLPGRPVEFKRITSEGELTGDYQILFLGESRRDRIPGILESLKNTSILTVGENEGFLDQNGIINLIHRNKKIRIEVNLAAARQAHLSISSKLLNVADTVKGKPN
jgi:hypothetical protein